MVFTSQAIKEFTTHILGFFLWVKVPPGQSLQPEATGATVQSLQPEATGATVEATKWLKPPVKRGAKWWQRECAGRNVSER
jgi:hypothetical protein